VQPMVRVDDLSFHIELQQSDGHRRRKLVHQLLAGSEFLLGGHFLGDIHDLADYARVLWIVEQVVVGDLKPDPRPIQMAVTQAHAASGTRTREHLHPVINRQRAVVRVYELNTAMSFELTGAPAENLRQPVVDVDDHAARILVHRCEPGDLGYLRAPVWAPGDVTLVEYGQAEEDAVLLAEVEHVAHAGYLRAARRVHGATGGTLGLHPFPRGQNVGAKHDLVRTRTALRDSVTLQGNRVGHCN